MDDEMEDRILLKLLSKGIPLNAAPFSYGWRMLRSYVLKPEILIFGVLIFVVYLYLQTLDVWSRGLFSKLQFSLDKPKSFRLFGVGVLENERLSWELKENTVAAYAVQGRRSKMEDRFVIVEDINDSGISLFAVFDGHGGEFAANYARDHLIKNINTKLMEVKNLQMESAKGEFNSSYTKEDSDKKAKEDMNKKSDKEQERKASFKKTASVTDECVKKESTSAGVTDPDLLKMLDSLQRPITREVRYRMPEKITKIPLTSYLDSSKFSGINYGKIISDEVVATDRLLVEAAKKTMDVAGTTALIALLEGDHLVVANVGDSRGVMCDSKGNAIPLSFDHKPQQIKERKRIREAGGFISFNGVWRVAGILATSRALGDYPLKDKNLVIPDPDILTFNLTDHKPLFMLLASDGLWDTFSNEEAVAFIKERLNEPHYGAKSIVLQSYYRGSLDNITVMVINFKDMKWSSYSAKKNS